MYITYLTIYSGDRLPPYYLGSTSYEKYLQGYHGSIASKEYKLIFKQELINNPHLFDTIILTEHNDRKEAYIQELRYQKQMDVVKNIKFMNKAYVSIGKKGFSHTQKHSDETKIKMSNKKSGGVIAGKNNPMYGKSCTEFMTKEEIELWKLNIGNALRDKNTGPISEERKQLLRKPKRLDHNMGSAISVQGIEFKKQKDACEYLNITRKVMQRLMKQEPEIYFYLQPKRINKKDI